MYAVKALAHEKQLLKKCDLNVYHLHKCPCSRVLDKWLQYLPGSSRVGIKGILGILWVCKRDPYLAHGHVVDFPIDRIHAQPWTRSFSLRQKTASGQLAQDTSTTISALCDGMPQLLCPLLQPPSKNMFLAFILTCTPCSNALLSQGLVQ